MLNVNVINAKNTQKVEVKPGQSANLKVDPNTRFELVDPVSGKAPTQIKARRVGDNLEIVTDEKAQIEDDAISNTQQPDLVLENYFKQADVSLFAGTGEEAVSYVPVDGIASGSYAAMNTSATTGAALGVLPFINPLLGAAVIGAGVVVARNSGPDNQLPIALDAASKVTENKVVSDKVPTATDADGTVVSYRLVDNVAAGKLTFNADGSYSFEANKDFDNLAEGQTRTVSFTYSAVDNAGGVSAPKTVTITVTGVNDAPIAIAATKAVDEGVKVAGSVAATDADAGATLKYALVGAAPIGLSFNADGRYSFDAADVAYDSLKAGETKDVVVKFKANDGTVDSAEQTLTITVKGTNDAAKITGTSTGSVTEDGTLSASGTLTVKDADTGESGFKVPTALSGVYGAFTFDVNTGNWSYTADNSKLQALSKTSEAMDKLTIQSLDGTAKDIVVTLNGINDTPIANAATVSVNEGKTVAGKVTATDADMGATLTYALLATSPAGLTFKEDGSYSFDANNSAYDGLASSKTQDVTVKYKANDGLVDSTEQTLKITVTGTNDKPTTAFNGALSATEDGAIINQKLTATDKDQGDSLTYKLVAQQDILTKLGLSLDGDQLSFDPKASNWQSLGEGDISEIKVDYQVSDGIDTVNDAFTLKVTGVNDAPIFEIGAGDKKLAQLMEDPDKAVSATGTLTINDPDAQSVSCTVSKVNVAMDSQYKLLTGNQETDLAALDDLLKMLTIKTGDVKIENGKGSIAWKFDSGFAAALDPIPKNEVLKLEYQITANDGNNGKAVQTLIVEITGTNDAPKVLFKTGDSADGKVTDTAKNVTGSLSIYDEDKVDVFFSGVSIDGEKINDSATRESLFKFFAYDADTSTFKTKNEPGNYDWIFLTKDAADSPVFNQSNLEKGDHTLTYHMLFEDSYGLSTAQDINILFAI